MDDSEKTDRILAEWSQYEDVDDALIKMDAKIEQLQAENKLKEQSRCPCGGTFKGIGYYKGKEVWECTKCKSQIILSKALKGK